MYNGQKLGANNYYDHIVRYPDGSLGTRIHDGHVYKNEGSRLSDHDIVKIIDNSYTDTSKSLEPEKLCKDFDRRFCIRAIPNLCDDIISTLDGVVCGASR